MEPWKEFIVKGQINEKMPQLKPGDMVDVHYRVVEGEKERIQIFTGTVISIRGGDTDASFMVRKIASGGIGVERIFPWNSPFISKVEIIRHSFVRRAKLYYLRGLRGKAARLREAKIQRPSKK
ncbi:MAG: 50S ribosomal protein L19 [Candidatus Electryoneaceae bacterium]|nr:50S ribosomal protein L19 [Candidatus Electryoneaceae bacterium]